MSFLTSSGAGIAGLIPMRELSATKNFYVNPPYFPPPAGRLNLNGLGTLVDSVGGGSPPPLPRRRRVRRRGNGAIPIPCAPEMTARRTANAAFRACANRTMVQAGLEAPGTSNATRASEGALLGDLGSTLRLPNDRPKGYHGQYGSSAVSGLGDMIPYKSGPNSSAGQGSWLSPSQIPAAMLESAEELIAQPQSFTGPGLGAHGGPRAIGRRIGGQSALRTGRTTLPAWYHHPQLGPWGVDPTTAYQYWWSQQLALQSQATGGSPLAIWGSPGVAKDTPPLGPASLAQTPAFDPYSEAYPTAGAAVERF